jgi:hypothetical protein
MPVVLGQHVAERAAPNGIQNLVKVRDEGVKVLRKDLLDT